jgi:hypothetical protein
MTDPNPTLRQKAKRLGMTFWSCEDVLVLLQALDDVPATRPIRRAFEEQVERDWARLDEYERRDKFWDRWRWGKK